VAVTHLDLAADDDGDDGLLSSRRAGRQDHPADDQQGEQNNELGAHASPPIGIRKICK
jgi:hypothetical protein